MKISVAMAYYNGGTYIEEQMDSILSQLGNQDEVIVWRSSILNYLNSLRSETS